MYWYNYLYADKKVHHISRLKYKIEKGMPHKGVYLIHLPECGSTLLEVIPSVLLQQSHYPKESLCIVGIGSSRGSLMKFTGNREILTFHRICRLVEDLCRRAG